MTDGHGDRKTDKQTNRQTFWSIGCRNKATLRFAIKVETSYFNPEKNGYFGAKVGRGTVCNSPYLLGVEGI